MIYILRFGELFLKKKNKNIFIKQLIKNLTFLLKNYEFKILGKFGSLLLVEILNENNSFILNLLKQKLIGISKISVAEKIALNEILIKKKSLKLLLNQKNITSFALDIRRHDKKYHLNSYQIKNEIGHYLKSKTKLNVNLNNPNFILRIEYFTDFVLICEQTFSCINGLPPGVSGKGIHLLSSGIDSPVAAFLLFKRGFHLDFVHFYRENSETKLLFEKISNQIKTINEFQLRKSKIYFIDLSLLMQELQCNCPEGYRLLILKRYFYLFSEYIKIEYNYDFISTGESLCQVSSQTIQNLDNISKNLNSIVIRPLSTYNKEEIISVAKQINTYTVSINGVTDCCQIFAGKKPKTVSKYDKILKWQNLNINLDIFGKIKKKLIYIENT